MKKAIAYVCDIPLGRTGEIIGKNYQRELISGHAKEHGIEIVAWFEDDRTGTGILERDGVKAMLEYEQPYDKILVERFWSLSRSMPEMETLFREIDKRGKKVEAATTMWDCVSQQCRHIYKPDATALEDCDIPITVRHRTTPVRVKKPAKLHFLPLMGKA